MSDFITQGAVKIIEVLGVSRRSYDDAVNQAVKKASKTVKGINGVEVLRLLGSVENGKITQYRANVKIAFPVD